MGMGIKFQLSFLSLFCSIHLNHTVVENIQDCLQGLSSDQHLLGKKPQRSKNKPKGFPNLVFNIHDRFNCSLGSLDLQNSPVLLSWEIRLRGKSSWSQSGRDRSSEEHLEHRL